MTAQELDYLMRTKKNYKTGFAFVRQSTDPGWPMWACMFPGDRPTEWFKTEAQAQSEADLFNGTNL